MNLQKFYFTFGIKEEYPFCGGWVEVHGTDTHHAITLFMEKYPMQDASGCINCADIYKEKAFKEYGFLEEGNLGAFCHEVIMPEVEDVLEKCYKAEVSGRLLEKYGVLKTSLSDFIKELQSQMDLKEITFEDVEFILEGFDDFQGNLIGNMNDSDPIEPSKTTEISELMRKIPRSRHKRFEREVLSKNLSDEDMKAAILSYCNCDTYASAYQADIEK